MSTPTTVPLIDPARLALNDPAAMRVQHVEVAGTPALVVDDVYADPEAVRGLALSLNYHREAGAYPGFVAFVSITSDPLRDLINEQMAERLGHEVAFTPFYQDDMTFAVTTKRGADLTPGQRRPHCDGFCAYAGIVYLNAPEQCSGGTSFWRHRASGMRVALGTEGASPVPPLPEPIPEDRQDDPGTGYLIASDADWEMTQVLEMRFNRLVFYASHIFHSPLYDERRFGTTLDTQRLTQNLYFQIAGT